MELGTRLQAEALSPLDQWMAKYSDAVVSGLAGLMGGPLAGWMAGLHLYLHLQQQCGAVQCSAVQCSAVQCSAVQCSAVQWDVDKLWP